jgi:hypothetical protein
MSFKEQFDRGKEKLLNDKAINKDNRSLFKKFFEFEEYKLKRKNGLAILDDGCYKSLYGYLIAFKNVNSWFKNKAWTQLTKEDIKKVYDNLEEGKIKNQKGKPFKDRKSYYNRIFKSKPFDLAGKKGLAQEVIEFYNNKTEEVRYIELEKFKEMVAVLSKPEHKLLFWLAFDIGENINSLLQLRKIDFHQQIDQNNKQIEYRVNLPKEKLKRSRQSRSEITNFKETSEFLNIVLRRLKDDDLVFPFGYRNAKKILDRAVEITKAKCLPKGQAVTFKDLRSSMACYLLMKGWTSDEINSRLGHKPSSRELDKYINFLAINRHDSKKKLFDSDLTEMRMKMEEMEKREKLKDMRLKNQYEEIKEMISEIKRAKEIMKKV